ncbi:MAG: RNA polymerase subunit sigma [Rhodospirillaceae bacterium]|nr:RNA polymerase subunit sigma [Rhodospirillaceae bacterium]
MTRNETSLLVNVFEQNYDGLLRTLVVRLGDIHRAMDVVHDTYLRLVAASPETQEIRNPRAYVFRVAHNLAVDMLRREGRYVAETLHQAMDEGIEDEAPSPESALHGRERLRLLDDALAELPGNVREALLLSRVNGCSHAEIAERLGVSESMVAKYLAQGLRYCRDSLKDREAAP